MTVPHPARLVPLFHYNGGKRKLAAKIGAEILDYLATTNGTYYEPFCGSAAVALWMGWPKTVLADTAPQVMWCLREVVASPDAVALDLARLAKEKPDFYEIRRLLNGPVLLAGYSGAALFLWLQAHGFNGLMRVNASGALNAPKGDVKRPRLPTLAELERVAVIARGWELCEDDFAAVLRSTLPGDAAYLDPPYDGGFADYTKDGFTWEDQVRLADRAADARDRGVHVWISNAATDRIVRLYTERGFWVDVQDERRSISCKATTRGAARCVLIRGWR